MDTFRVARVAVEGCFTQFSVHGTDDAVIDYFAEMLADTMPREEAAPDDVAISNLADFIGQMLPESVGSMAPEDQVSLVKCMINLWRGTQAPQPPPAVLAPSKPECKAKAVPVSAPVPSERPPGLARTLSECSTPASLEETSDLILADTVHGAICQLLQLSECGLLADGSLDGTVVEYMCGVVNEWLDGPEELAECVEAFMSSGDVSIGRDTLCACAAHMLECRDRERAEQEASASGSSTPALRPLKLNIEDSFEYDKSDQRLVQLKDVAPHIPEAILARLLILRCNGDVAAAAAAVFDSDVVAEESRRVEAEKQRVAAQARKRAEEEQLNKLVRKRVLTKFGEQIDTTGKVYAPTIPGGVSSRLGPKRKPTGPQIRYLDNRIVANKGERYITVEDEEAVQRDKASHVSIKVITKRKGGKGYR